jgi:hypothetical protein
MNEKPLHLPMGFDEALTRLAKVPNKRKASSPIDYKKQDEKNTASAVKKPRQPTEK